MPLWSKYEAIGAFYFKSYNTITYRNKLQYRIDITITCYFSGYDGYSVEKYTKGDGMKSTYTHTIYVRNNGEISYSNLVLNTIYSGGHRNGNSGTTGTPAAFYVIDSISVTQL